MRKPPSHILSPNQNRAGTPAWSHGGRSRIWPSSSPRPVRQRAPGSGPPRTSPFQERKTKTRPSPVRKRMCVRVCVPNTYSSTCKIVFSE